MSSTEYSSDQRFSRRVVKLLLFFSSFVLLGALFCEPFVSSFCKKRPAMSTGNQDNRSKISTSLSKDHADANESKHSPSNGVEAGKS